jgi:hypothetical protein
LDCPRQLETDVRGVRRYWAVIDGDEYSFEGH